MNAIAGLILMVVTSHGEIAPGKPTGLWLEEFSVPYAAFRSAGYEVVVASPKGGPTPIDPRSLGESDDPEHLAVLKETKPLADIDPAEFVAVFFPGGHGTMFDLPDAPAVQRIVNAFLQTDRPAAFVCHGPAALVGAVGKDGLPAVHNRKVTAFTNDEERAVELEDEMPFLLQSRLEELGGVFKGAPNFEAHVVVDGNLITGQNPASSLGTAEALLALLQAATPRTD